MPTNCTAGSPQALESIGDTNLYFYCGVTEQQRELIIAYVRTALVSAPKDAALRADIYVADDLQQAAQARFEWLLVHGYPEGYQNILSHIRSDCAEAERGALFFYLSKECWSEGSEYPNGEMVLHEMHHLLQLELAGPLHGDLPAWLEEGGADFFALEGLNEERGLHIAIGPPSAPCTYRLADLETRDEASRVACVYWEGQHAVEWLIHAYGVDRYYELFEKTSPSRGFDDVFLETYGLRTPSFYRLFDEFRKSGYSILPAAPTANGQAGP